MLDSGLGRSLTTIAVLPTRRDENIPSAIPAREVTKVALRLKHQLEVVIPCELPEETITQAHSKIITDKVIETAKSAGGEQYRACVVYCLLVCKKWFKRQALIELWDADLHDVRAVACEVLAKQIIEREEDGTYLMEEVLLKRFATLVDGEETLPSNAVEKAVDLHALRVIGSAGYQRCINYLWRGWLIQDENDPSRFVDYKDKINTSFWAHLEPDRMRAPLYQNAVQIAFSIIFVALYTGAINTINPSGDLDVVEGLLYVFTLGFIADELAKFWKVGYLYLSFWPIFNSLLYALLTVSFAMRTVALSHSSGTDARIHFNELSYNFLAFSAPMFWVRLMLYLDSFRFFGAMLVVLKVMMKESIIFFALLIVVLVGFLQAFMGMDEVDSKLDAFGLITREMANAIMGSPNLDAFDDFAYPFGTILYYIFSFIIMVCKCTTSLLTLDSSKLTLFAVLLNILIALYNSAYEDITGNAIDEFMAIFAQKRCSSCAPRRKRVHRPLQPDRDPLPRPALRMVALRRTIREI